MKILNTILVSIVLAISAGHTFAQGTTAFTYQGRLNAGANAANGSYDMTFAVYDANVSGNQIAGPITNSAVAVTNGLFTVSLDFGAGVFTGTNYWVQMNVSPAGANTFAALTPRQQLTPAPYALSLVSPQATALCPPGSVMAYMGTNAPNGWLMCDGSAISRTQYAALFAVLGTASGQGDGSTTFNLPDMRGEFLRGVDNGSTGVSGRDPDVGSRTAYYTGGNAGNAVGSYQADAFQGHNHDFHCLAIACSGGGNANAPTVFLDYAALPSNYSADRPTQMVLQPTTGSYGNVRVSTETRPVNVYVNYIIKY